MSLLTLKSNGQQVDTAAFNVFTINGTLDVPGKGTYRYTGDHEFGGEWIAPIGGTGTPVAGNQNSVDITWANAAEVGYANYQVNSLYTWSCGVNVVAVTLSPTFGIPVPVRYNQALGQGGSGPLYRGSSKVLFAGNATAHAMDADITVNLQGPIPPWDPSGGQRGVKYISFGFVQDAQMTYEETRFYDGDVRYCVGQGGTWVPDYATSDPGPWQNPVSGFSTANPDPVAATPLPVPLWTNDTPEQQFTDTWGWFSDAVAAKLILQFQLFVTADLRRVRPCMLPKAKQNGNSTHLDS